jgi:hypothetical protein
MGQFYEWMGTTFELLGTKEDATIACIEIDGEHEHWALPLPNDASPLRQTGGRMTALELFEEFLRDAEESGLIDGWGLCPGVPRFDIETLSGKWIQVEVIWPNESAATD